MHPDRCIARRARRFPRSICRSELRRSSARCVRCGSHRTHVAQHVLRLGRQVHHLGPRLEMPASISRAEPKFGSMLAMRRGYPLRDHQHWNGLGYQACATPPVGGPCARPLLYAESADLLARGHAADRIRHMQPDVPAAQSRGGCPRRRHSQQVINGIAAKDFDPLALHDFGDSLTDLHPFFPSYMTLPAATLVPRRAGDRRTGAPPMATFWPPRRGWFRPDGSRRPCRGT